MMMTGPRLDNESVGAQEADHRHNHPLHKNLWHEDIIQQEDRTMIRSGRKQKEAMETIQSMRSAEDRCYRTVDYLRHDRVRAKSGGVDAAQVSSPKSISSFEFDQRIDYRSGMISWCYRVVDYFDLQHETVEIAVNLLDRFVPTPMALLEDVTHEHQERYQLAAVTALYLAIKVHEPKSISPSSLSELSQGLYSEHDIEDMELKMLQALSWRVNPPTAISFVRLGLELLDIQDKLTREMISDLSRIQTEIAVAEYDFRLFPPSIVAFCALANSIQVVVADGADEARIDIRPLEQALVLQQEDEDESSDDASRHWICQKNPVLKTIQSWLYDALTNNDDRTSKGKLFDRCMAAVKSTMISPSSTKTSSVVVTGPQRKHSLHRPSSVDYASHRSLSHLKL